MNNEVKTISPFRNFCITIGALPTSYLESMTYYEMLCWLCKYLENTINPAINQNAEALKELQEYVANYFDNLDVQEEINNKLDDMAESGTLADIINVEMIGSLSDLDTTDKTDIVSAINENVGSISDLKDFLNINSFHTYTTFTTNFGTATGSITVARNSEGSLCKIYGYISATDLAETGTMTCLINADTGLRPASDLYISGTGLTFSTSSGTLGVSNPGIQLYTDGKVGLHIYSNLTPSTTRYFACLIFVKDFGD